MQALSLLMHLASGSPAAQQPFNNSEGDACGVLKQTLASLLRLGQENCTRSVPATDPPNMQHMHRATATQGTVHAETDDATASRSQGRLHWHDLGVHTICIALLESISEEGSAVASFTGRAEQHGCEHGGMGGRLHPDDQPCNPSSSATDSLMLMHAWDVVQCLLLDLLCCIVRLHGSQSLGALVSRAKKFCQQHEPNTASGRARVTSGRNGELCGSIDTELWTYTTAWVLNVRFHSFFPCDAKRYVGIPTVYTTAVWI